MLRNHIIKLNTSVYTVLSKINRWVRHFLSDYPAIFIFIKEKVMLSLWPFTRYISVI